MKLDTFAKNQKMIDWLQTLSFEQRDILFKSGCALLHGKNPVTGKERKKVLAQTYAIQVSYVTDPNPIVRQKAEIDFQKVKAYINKA